MTTPQAPLPQPLPAAARERVVELLTRHFANDDLTEAELDVRLKRVYSATTGRELDAIVADLPLLPGSAARSVPARHATEITALLSGQERRLTGIVARELKLRARLGYVELDLRGATFAPGITTIDVRAFMGYAEIRLPRGVQVESTGCALFGFFSLKGAQRSGAREAAPAESVVRITGQAALGYAEVKVS